MAGRHGRISRLITLFAFITACIAVLPADGRAGGWPQVETARVWSFPRDLGAHPEYRTEWWYFTGNLKDEAGNRYGYQLTFFRHAMRCTPDDARNPWSVRDLYLAHFTVTDVTKKRFVVDERVSRAGPALSGARTDGLDVWLLNWSARSNGTTISLHARNDTQEIALTLNPRKPLVLQGEKGLSRKGPNRGQASYYVSYTDLATEGSLKTAGSTKPVTVRGVSWFDHEFGSNQLTAEQAGWDWFSLHLSDGRDVMLYFLRRNDGSIERASSGTIVYPDGAAHHLPLSAIHVDVLDLWKSPNSKAVYPGRWRVRIPTEHIDLTITPLLPDQELVTSATTAVTYWEGAVAGKGKSAGSTVTAEGYVEMTGYAGKLGGVF
jgi:predicted secreted hydrolase